MHTRWSSSVSLFTLCLVVGCGAERTEGTSLPPADGGDSGVAPGDARLDDADSGGFVADALPEVDAAPAGSDKVYANTDKDLWEMNPTTKSITRIGDFQNADGTAFAESMTDVAVNATGDLWGCTVGKIYQLDPPAAGSGPVKVSLKVTIPSSNRFYALAFAPKGVLDPAEALVGGDAAGDLYLIPTAGASTPVKVGTFGPVLAGEPGLGAAGDVWQLSGDIAFFSNSGDPIGLATLRPCSKSGDPSSCKNGNDVVVQIDMAALAKKSATSNLKKGFVGKSGTGYGRLYGVGAWGDEVFAFQRYSTSGTAVTALFLSVSLADGKGTIIKDFPEIAAAKNGWSGAGVTTAAKVFVPK